MDEGWVPSVALTQGANLTELSRVSASASASGRARPASCLHCSAVVLSASQDVPLWDIF